jgi:hypothetical protein
MWSRGRSYFIVTFPVSCILDCYKVAVMQHLIHAYFYSCYVSAYISQIGSMICIYIYIYIYIYCHVPGVVWLITRRGFGLDTGFIHYGDYNYTSYNYIEHFSTRSFSDPTDETALHCSDVTIRGLPVSTDGLRRLTQIPETKSLWFQGLNNSLWFQGLTD